ncbi:MAG: glycosyltransferase [Paracoccaceae bacterium]
MKRLLAAERVAHVHVHFTTNACAVAMLSRLMGGPPFSVTAHGPAEFYDRAGQSLDLKVRHAAFVVAISHFAKTRVLQAAGMEAWDKVHVVRLGVDLDAFALQPAPDRDAPFVTVGRLCLNKAQALIPAAVARAAERHPAIRVALIGGGEHETLVRGAIARHGVGDRVEMLGWRAHAEVRERMAGARALLLPSFAEGIPVVIMEALALGRPVISTYIAGIPELVTPDCGWLVPPGDAEALGRALDAALATPPERLAEMGRAGRARVARLHDRPRSAAAMHALFAEAVEGAAAG